MSQDLTSIVTKIIKEGRFSNTFQPASLWTIKIITVFLSNATLASLCILKILKIYNRKLIEQNKRKITAVEA